MKNLELTKTNRSQIETRIDVTEESDSVLLKQSAWTESIGWMTQKTLRLDLKSVSELKLALEEAEKHLLDNQKKQGNNVIDFPTQ